MIGEGVQANDVRPFLWCSVLGDRHDFMKSQHKLLGMEEKGHSLTIYTSPVKKIISMWKRKRRKKLSTVCLDMSLRDRLTVLYSRGEQWLLSTRLE